MGMKRKFMNNLQWHFFIGTNFTNRSCFSYSISLYHPNARFAPPPLPPLRLLSGPQLFSRPATLFIIPTLAFSPPRQSVYHPNVSLVPAPPLVYYSDLGRLYPRLAFVFSLDHPSGVKFPLDGADLVNQCSGRLCCMK